MLSYIKKYHKSGLFATKFSKQKDNSSSCMYNVTIIHVNKLHICGLYIYIALNLKDTCISEASNFIFVLRLKKKNLVHWIKREITPAFAIDSLWSIRMSLWYMSVTSRCWLLHVILAQLWKYWFSAILKHYLIYFDWLLR